MSFISWLKKNRIFKFLASVKLAVPLLIVLASSVAVGTVLESRYDAEYARLLVYQASWFYPLIGLLALNVLCAALSRMPYKINHLGFVIIHIGILTLILGAYVTSRWGIDGQLTLMEGEAGNSVLLSNDVLRVSDGQGSSRSVPIPRWMSQKSAGDLSSVNQDLGPIRVQGYLPFSRSDQSLVSAPQGEAGIEFLIKGPFGETRAWLQARHRPEMELGRAVFRLVQDQPRKAEAGPELLVFANGATEPTARFSLTELKRGARIGDVQLRLKQRFEQAMVQQKKIVDGGQRGKNPALDLELESAGKKAREVAFALFPEFSMNTTPPFGLRFRFNVQQGMQNEGSNAGDVVEFHVNPEKVGSIQLVLRKNGETVLSKPARVGEAIQTPWMGLQIVLSRIEPRSSVQDSAEPVALQEKSPLPPPALLVSTNGTNVPGFWLTEGQSGTLVHEGKNYEIYFGREIETLPFRLKLLKFSKVDYPGSETALSFESKVSLNNSLSPVVISMNEPLKAEGYTIYQSSYIVEPGQPAASIFSVNRDPGRWIKYFGAFLMSVGTIVFTLMRSKRYQRWKARQA